MAQLTRLCFEEHCSDIPVVYSKEEVNALIAGLENVYFEIVEELPTEGETNVIYLVPNEGETPNIYDEYIWIYDPDTDAGVYELIGSTAIDLSNYYNKAEIDNLLLAKVNVNEVNKQYILNALGYEETSLVLTDTNGNSTSKTILVKTEV